MYNYISTLLYKFIYIYAHIFLRKYIRSRSLSPINVKFFTLIFLLSNFTILEFPIIRKLVIPPLAKYSLDHLRLFINHASYRTQCVVYHVDVNVTCVFIVHVVNGCILITRLSDGLLQFSHGSMEA